MTDHLVVSVALAGVAAVLVGAGVTLLLSRSLTRSLLGFLLLGNGINIVFLVASGPADDVPIIGLARRAMSDPLPQALVLTAIVISLAATGFVLALAHRQWLVGRSDVVGDDTESARLAQRARENAVEGPTADQESAELAGAFVEEERDA